MLESLLCSQQQHLQHLLVASLLCYLEHLLYLLAHFLAVACWVGRTLGSAVTRGTIYRLFCPLALPAAADLTADFAAVVHASAAGVVSASALAAPAAADKLRTASSPAAAAAAVADQYLPAAVAAAAAAAVAGQYLPAAVAVAVAVAAPAAAAAVTGHDRTESSLLSKGS
jgi:hypothetical protein